MKGLGFFILLTDDFCYKEVRIQFAPRTFLPRGTEILGRETPFHFGQKLIKSDACL